MLPLPHFKTLLGSLGERMTDEQVRRVYDMEKKIADAIFDQWKQGTHRGWIEIAGNRAQICCTMSYEIRL